MSCLRSDQDCNPNRRMFDSLTFFVGSPAARAASRFRHADRSESALPRGPGRIRQKEKTLDAWRTMYRAAIARPRLRLADPRQPYPARRASCFAGCDQGGRLVRPFYEPGVFRSRVALAAMAFRWPPIARSLGSDLQTQLSCRVVPGTDRDITSATRLARTGNQQDGQKSQSGELERGRTLHGTCS